MKRYLTNVILAGSMVLLFAGCTADHEVRQTVPIGIDGIREEPLAFLVERIVADPAVATQDLINQGGVAGALRQVDTEDHISHSVRVDGIIYLFAEADSWFEATGIKFEIGDTIYHFVLESRDELEEFIEDRGLRREMKLLEVPGMEQPLYRVSEQKFFMLAINEPPNNKSSSRAYPDLNHD